MTDAASPPVTVCDDQRVVLMIGGQHIPTLEIETIHNKDGVADRNTFTRAIIPATWKNEDILSKIDAYSDTNGYFNTANVYWQDASIGTWVHVQSGFIRSIGGGSKSGTAKLIIGGWSQFFTSIPFSKTFDAPTVSTVLNEVANRFIARTGVSLSTTGLGTPDTIQEGDQSSLPLGGSRTGIQHGGKIGIVDRGKASFEDDTIQTTKNFVSNRHTLKDVMEWICGETDSRWFIDIDDGTPVLVLDALKDVKHFYDNSLEQSPGCRVVDNDAVQEIVPINTLTVNGKSSVGTHGFRIKELSSGKYPTATVQYDTLVSAANGDLLHPIEESETLTVEATENKARRKLKEKIAGASEGDITMFGKPDIEPFNHFTGPPVCNMHHVGDSSPIEYEVTNVQHKKKGGGEFGTRIGVHIWIDSDKISTKKATMVEQ